MNPIHMSKEPPKVINKSLDNKFNIYQSIANCSSKLCYYHLIVGYKSEYRIFSVIIKYDTALPSYDVVSSGQTAYLASSVKLHLLFKLNTSANIKFNYFTSVTSVNENLCTNAMKNINYNYEVLIRTSHYIASTNVYAQSKIAHDISLVVTGSNGFIG